jgi:hypothetical protein
VLHHHRRRIKNRPHITQLRRRIRKCIEGSVALGPSHIAACAGSPKGCDPLFFKNSFVATRRLSDGGSASSAKLFFLSETHPFPTTLYDSNYKYTLRASDSLRLYKIQTISYDFHTISFGREFRFRLSRLQKPCAFQRGLLTSKIGATFPFQCLRATVLRAPPASHFFPSQYAYHHTKSPGFYRSYTSRLGWVSFISSFLIWSRFPAQFCTSWFGQIGWENKTHIDSPSPTSDALPRGQRRAAFIGIRERRGGADTTLPYQAFREFAYLSFFRRTAFDIILVCCLVSRRPVCGYVSYLLL